MFSDYFKYHCFNSFSFHVIDNSVFIKNSAKLCRYSLNAAKRAIAARPKKYATLWPANWTSSTLSLSLEHQRCSDPFRWMPRNCHRVTYRLPRRSGATRQILLGLPSTRASLPRLQRPSLLTDRLSIDTHNLQTGWQYSAGSRNCLHRRYAFSCHDVVLLCMLHATPLHSWTAACLALHGFCRYSLPACQPAWWDSFCRAMLMTLAA